MKIALRSMGTSTFLKNVKKINTKNVLLYVYRALVLMEIYKVCKWPRSSRRFDYSGLPRKIDTLNFYRFS